MKNKKSILTLAIVALILVLGVGYAVVSNQTLTISGTAGAADATLNVVYDGTNSGVTGKVTAISSPDNATTATFTVEEMVLNETVEVEFEIKNKETDINASVAVPTVTNTKNEFFETTVYYDDAAWTAAKTLNAGATAKVKVAVKLIKVPVVEADETTTITVSYVASPVAGA